MILGRHVRNENPASIKQISAEMKPGYLEFTRTKQSFIALLIISLHIFHSKGLFHCLHMHTFTHIYDSCL